MVSGIDATFLMFWPPALVQIVQERLWDSLSSGTAPYVSTLVTDGSLLIKCHHYFVSLLFTDLLPNISSHF